MEKKIEHCIKLKGDYFEGAMCNSLIKFKTKLF